MSKRLLLITVFVCLLSGFTTVPDTLGWLEGAYLQPWGVRVRAKLDSGALTSSIHAEDIETYSVDGEQWVRFLFPFGGREGYGNGFIIDKPLLREVNIKEHDSENSVRYVIELDICISGNTFPVEFSLANRSKFNYPIILGRKALSGRYLVDPGRSFLGKRTCPRRNRNTGKVERP